MGSWLTGILTLCQDIFAELKGSWGYRIVNTIYVLSLLALKGIDWFAPDFSLTLRGVAPATILAWQSWLVLALLIILIAAIDGARRLREKQSGQAGERATRAEAELARVLAKPIIDLVVKDVFILPFDGEARCFLYLSLHNQTDVPCSNPTEYHFSLKIAGKSYQEGAFIHLPIYQLEHYKLVETYTKDERQEEEESLSRERLRDIRTQQVNLTKGAPVEGWLGFAFHYVPKWQADKEYIGIHYEEVYEEQLGGMMQISVDDFHLVHNTNTVEELEVTVVDAYRQEWPAILTGSFTKRGKRIVPPSPPQDWD